MPVAMTNVIGNFTASGAYVYKQPAQASPTTGSGTDLCGAVGPAMWGPFNKAVQSSGKNQLYDTWGYPISSQYSMVADVIYTIPRAPNIVGVRVGDGTQTAAQIFITDTAGTPGTIFKLLGYYEGTRPNPGVVTSNGAVAKLVKAASWTTSKPVYTLQAAMPGGAPESWTNIVGWKLVSGTPTPDTPTLVTNVLAAVNQGTLASRRSRYFIAVAGTSSATPLLDTQFTVSVLGTDGASGVTPTTLIGVDGTSGRTGMYALEGSGVGQFILCGCTDLTTAGAQALLAQSELSFSVGPLFPSGTQTSDAVTAKQTNNINSPYQAPVIDWLSVRDAVSGQQNLVSPLGCVMGIIASMPPWLSPMNQPDIGIPDILGTEQNGAPLGAEAGQREQAGILYIGPLQRKSTLYGLPHGQNASGAGDQTGGIKYTRLTNYLMRLIPLSLGPVVGENQGYDDPDPAREDARARVTQQLTVLKNQKAIQSFQVLDPASMNLPITIDEGYLLMAIEVGYYGEVRYIVATLDAGGSGQVKIQSSSAQLAQAA